MTLTRLHRLWVLAGLLAAVACLSAAGCKSGDKGGGPGGDANVLRLAQVQDLQSLDPAVAFDQFSASLVRGLYQGLVDYGDGVDLVPWAAEKLPDLSADGRTYTFHLKQGLRFANGRELTAEDFVYSIERILDPQTKSPGDGYFRNLLGADAFAEAREKEEDEAKDEPVPRTQRRLEPTHLAGLRAPGRYTLEIELERPDLAFLNVLTMGFAYAVPREEVERYGEDFFRHPVGTGPYVLAEWTRGVRIRLRRNPDYTGGEAPPLDGVDVMLGPDAFLQEMMFERGELDMVMIPGADFVRITTDRHWKTCVRSLPQNSTDYLAFNCRMEPFTDVRVRQALNYAVNKERLIRMANGRGVIAHGVLAPVMPGYNPHLEGYPYDPARARHLLAEAGHPTVETEIWVIADSGYQKMAEAIQEDWREVGVTARINASAFGVFNDAIGRKNTVPSNVYGWVQDYPDPSDFLDVLLSGARIVDENCNNTAFYSNPQVDELLQKADRETDRARRLGLYQQAEEIIVNDAPWVFLDHPIDYRLVQPWVQGFEMHPVWYVRLEKLRLERP